MVSSNSSNQATTRMARKQLMPMTILVQRLVQQLQPTWTTEMQKMQRRRRMMVPQMINKIRVLQMPQKLMRRNKRMERQKMLMTKKMGMKIMMEKLI